MRVILILAFCLSVLVIAPQASATNQGEFISYGQTVTSSIEFISGSVCGQFVRFTFEGTLGDVISIHVTRLSGNVKPVITMNEGSQAAKSTLAFDGASADLENYVVKVGELHVFEVSSLDNTEGDFAVTLRLVGQQPSFGTQSFTVGSRPTHSVWDGNQLYVSNLNSQSISVLNLDGQLVRTIEFPGAPSSMQWDGSRLWVGDRYGNSVYVFDAEGNQLARYEVGYSPISLSYVPEYEMIWVALYDDSQVVLLDMEGQEQFRVDTPTNPSTILTDSADGGSYAWVALYGDDVTIGNTVLTIGIDGQIFDQFEYSVQDYVNDLTWGDGYLYVAYGGSNILTQIDIFEGSQRSVEIENGNIIEVQWAADYLWLTLDTYEVIALDYDGYDFTQIPIASTDARPFGITYADPYLWVTNRGTQNNPGQTITRIDLAALGMQ